MNPNTVDTDNLDRLSKNIVFLILVLGFIWGFYSGKISDEGFGNVVMVVIGYFFGRAEVPKSPTEVPKNPVVEIVTSPHAS